jgi:hypothetical protein
MGTTAADWSPASLGPPSLSAASGAFTWDFASATTADNDGQIYRTQTDLYAVQESSAVRGSRHRAFYKQNAEGPRYGYEYFFISDAGGWNDMGGNNPTGAYLDGRYFFRVDFSDVSDSVDADDEQTTDQYEADPYGNDVLADGFDVGQTYNFASGGNVFGGGANGDVDWVELDVDSQEYRIIIDAPAALDVRVEDHVCNALADESDTNELTFFGDSVQNPNRIRFEAADRDNFFSYSFRVEED